MLTQLISASAGTGKTYNIVQKITKLLETVSAQNIAVITFTRDAAKELEERISLALQNKNIKIIKDKKNLFIGTIDGFFAKILKENAPILKINSQYSMITESFNKILLNNLSIDLLKGEINNPKYKILFNFYNASEIVEALITLQKKDEFLGNKNYSYEDIFNSEVNEIINLKNQISEIEQEREFYINEKTESDKLLIGIDILTKAFKNIEKTIKLINIKEKNYTNLANIEELPPLKLTRSYGSKANFDTEENKKKLANKAVIIKENIKDLLIYDTVTQKKFLNGLSTLIDVKYSLYTLYKKLSLKFKDLKFKENIMEFKDIEYYLKELLKNDKIVKRYKNKYKYILIDEFQDTNYSQKYILDHLAENLIMVGDAKQSIYRFRRADVRVFLETEQNTPENQKEVLETSWRSSVAVVDSVNHIFENIFKKENLEYDIKYQAFKAHKDANAGEVESYLLRNDIEFSKAVISKIKELKDKEYKDFAILLSRRTGLSKITKEFTKQNIPYSIEGRTQRPYTAIRLLNLLNTIENPNNNIALFDTINLAKFFIPQSSLLISTKNNKKDSSLYKKIKEEALNQNFIVFLDEAKELLFTSNFVDFIIFVLKKSFFIETINKIYPEESAGLDEAIMNLAITAKAEQTESLTAFQIFKKYLENKALDEFGVSSSNNAVKIMTVHGSKGLEFDTVFVPCPNNSGHNHESSSILYVSQEKDDINFSLNLRKFNNFKLPLYTKLKELEKEASFLESKRLLYVATTRAKNNLYMYILYNYKDTEDPLQKFRNLSDGQSWAKMIRDFDLKEDNISLNPKVLVFDDKNKPSQSSQYRYSIESKKMNTTLLNQNIKPIYSVTELIKQDNNNKKASYSKGVFLHNLLEHIDDGFVPKSPEIKDFMESNIAKEIFSKKGINEYPFTLELEDKIIKGRIDRFVIHKNKIIIYDYKTLYEKEILDNKTQYIEQLKYYIRYLKTKFTHEIEAKIISIPNKKAVLVTR